MKNTPISGGSGTPPAVEELQPSDVTTSKRSRSLSVAEEEMPGSNRSSSARLLLPASPSGHSWFGWLCVVAGWSVAMVLALAALLRNFFHDATLTLTCINSFTLYVYLPAYLIFACAVWHRRWLLAVVCVFVIGCHVIWVAPAFSSVRQNTVTAAGDTSRQVKIFCGNVAAMNENRDKYLEEVVRANADIVVFVEYRRHWHESVVASSLMNNYQYGTGITETYLGEIAIFSKLPIKRVERYWPTGRQICDVDVAIGGEALRLLCIHSPRPMSTPGNHYYSYWDETLRLVTNRTGPTIALGDFNATPHSKVYEAITASGLRSAHADRGRGWAVTWPNGELAIPPIAIDHAFLSPEVECMEILEGTGSGSDHKPLVLTVRVQAPNTASSKAIEPAEND